MICLKCGNAQQQVTGDVEILNRPIGPFTVSNVTYSFCKECNKKSFPRDAILAIEAAETRAKLEAIGSLPISEFFSGPQAIEFLEMTKQGFQQNKHIQRGFVYSFEIGGRKFYSKKSASLFKEEGDGRFRLLSSVFSETFPFNKQVHLEETPNKYKKAPGGANIYPMEFHYEDTESIYAEEG